MLGNKVKDQEDWGRRSNLRLVGLPEKPKVSSFLENWLLTALGDMLTSAPTTEQAHQIGQVNSSQPSAPKPWARRQKEMHFENQRVNFFPDLLAETPQQPQWFDGVKAQFRSMNIHYGLFYPAQLVITHDGWRLIFKSVAEAENFLQGLESTLQRSWQPSNMRG